MLVVTVVSLALVLQSQPTFGSASDTAQLGPVRDALVQAVRNKNAGALAAGFTVDGVMARGNSGKIPPTGGRQAIEDLWQKAFATMNGPNPYRVGVREVSLGSERALEQGEFGPDGGPWVGTYVLLYERQPDGRWSIAYWKFYTSPAHSP